MTKEFLVTVLGPSLDDISSDEMCPQIVFVSKCLLTLDSERTGSLAQNNMTNIAIYQKQQKMNNDKTKVKQDTKWCFTSGKKKKKIWATLLEVCMYIIQIFIRCII